MLYEDQIAPDRAARAAAAQAAAVALLRARQSPEGAWRSDCDQGPAVTAQAAIALAWVDAVEPDLAAAVCRWLLSRQRPDGGWPAGPLAAASDLGATATCWAALRRLGCADAAALAAAERWIDAAGGLLALRRRAREADAALWFLAMAGVIDGRALPRLPMGWRRAPGLARWLEGRIHDGIQLMILQLGAIGRRLSGEWGAPPAGRARRDADAALALLEDYRNPDGSWLGFVPVHALALAAAHACGAGPGRVGAGVAWLRSRIATGPDGAWFTAYDPDIWTTGIAIRSLRLAGVAPDDPAVAAGAGWLLAGQSLRPMPRATQRRPGAPRAGGWGFGAANVCLPDTDDTGIAVLALSMCEQRPDVARSIALGEEWLRGMQNPDGGFPAFTWNVSRRPAGALPLAQPGQVRGVRGALRWVRSLSPALTDYPAEDLNGRVLRALGALGRRVGDPAIDGAIAWLRAMQCDHGGWWGKWVTPYVVATADVLSGLRAVGVPADDPMVRRALAFLLTRQQPDGGWGETAAAYLDPAQIGAAPASCPLTAWTLTGLLPWLGADHPSVLRGIDYLLERQEADGGWPSGNHLHVYLPPDRVYALPASALLHGLEALALWLEASP